MWCLFCPCPPIHSLHPNIVDRFVYTYFRRAYIRRSPYFHSFVAIIPFSIVHCAVVSESVTVSPNSVQNSVCANLICICYCSLTFYVHIKSKHTRFDIFPRECKEEEKTCQIWFDIILSTQRSGRSGRKNSILKKRCRETWKRAKEMNERKWRLKRVETSKEKKLTAHNQKTQNSHNKWKL